MGVCVLVLSVLAQSEPSFAQDAPKPPVVRVYLVSKDVVLEDDEGRAVRPEILNNFYVVK